MNYLKETADKVWKIGRLLETTSELHLSSQEEPPREYRLEIGTPMMIVGINEYQPYLIQKAEIMLLIGTQTMILEVEDGAHAIPLKPLSNSC